MVLIKYLGKYVKIYFNMKITYTVYVCIHTHTKMHTYICIDVYSIFQEYEEPVYSYSTLSC